MERQQENQSDLRIALNELHRYMNRNSHKELDGFYSVLLPEITFEGIEYTIYKFNLTDFTYEIITE